MHQAAACRDGQNALVFLITGKANDERDVTLCFVEAGTSVPSTDDFMVSGSCVAIAAAAAAAADALQRLS